MNLAKFLLPTIILSNLLCAANAEQIMLAPKEIIDDYLEIADNYAFAGDYKKALDYINMVVEFEPMNPTAKYKKALLLTTLNKNDEAKEIFAQALKLNPKFANSELAILFNQQPTTEYQEPAHHQPGQIAGQTTLFSQGQDNNKTTVLPSSQYTPDGLPQAPPVLKNLDTSANTIKPYSSEYYNQLGLQYLNNGDNKKAYESFLKAIETDKKNFEAINNLGLFYWQQGENKLAEAEFKKASSINPTSPKPLINLGLLYKEMGKDKKYYEHINKALKLNPNDYLANWVVANYYAETARPMNAIKLYQKAIDCNKDFYDGYVSMGNVLASIQNFEQAYEAFQKALTINPADPNLYYLMSKTASILDRDMEAKEYILYALDLAQDEKYYLELAKIASKMGDYEEALDILMRRFPDTNEPEILNYIGLAYYKINQPQIAIKYFTKLIEMDKSKITYLYNLALCYKSIGERNLFFKYVDMATKILPKTPQDYIDLSYIYFDNGNKSFALNVLNDGILKYPNEKKIYMAKLSLFETSGDTKNYAELKTQ